MHQAFRVPEGGAYRVRRRRRELTSRLVRTVERRGRPGPPRATRWPNVSPAPAVIKRLDGGIERLPMGTGGYDLVTRLGGGGMADVFLARRRGLHGIEHDVVIKRLRDDVRALPTITKMFTWEAWISSRLCHPNIAAFYDFVSHRGRDHLVLEHVRGPDVATMIRALRDAGRAFPVRAVIDVGIAAARALAHAHALADEDGRMLGLVHRDVSPQNILVSVDGQVKLIDFGVAKTTSLHVPRESEPALVKGKMGYIAPEHLRGQPLDARSDLYGLGVVLFEMLTGTPLLRRSEDMEMMHAALLLEVPQLTALRPDCPSSLDALVRRALARNPDDRFESAGAMERALVEVASGVDEEVGTPTLTEIARSVYTSHDGRHLNELRTNFPHLLPAAPVVAHAQRRPSAEEPKTRPEGVRRAEAPDVGAAPHGDAPVSSSSAQQIVAATTPPPKRQRSHAWSKRAVPLFVAFVCGVIIAATALDLARKKEATSNEPTHGSAAPRLYPQP